MPEPPYTADRWARVEQLFHATLEQPPEGRAGFLSHACATDAELRREVESLLAQHGAGDSLFERPALEHAGLPAGPAAGANPGWSAGMMVGAYRILGSLGAGGMGEVFRARDTRLGRDVALKTLAPAVASDRSYLDRFRREARVLAALNHPNVATLHGIEEADGGFVLVMELVEGETLAKRRGADNAGPLPIDMAIGYARQIAAGLEAAHEKGIIHRDLKPANIKVTPEGTVKILDFGLAKVAEAPASAAPGVDPSASPTLSLAMTEKGMILGTAAYMSPEQARGQTVDKRADIWAFGVILYELLTGKMLFGGSKNVSDSLAAVLTHEPDFRTLPTETPPRVRRLLEHCLRKDPKQRLRDIGDARIALDDSEADAPGPPARRWVPWSVAGALGLVLIVVGGLFWRATRAGELKPAEGMRSILLTSYPGAERSPTFSPDGRQVAFAWNGEKRGNYAIYVTMVDGGDPLRLTHDPADDTAPAWSPEGRFIAFVRNHSIYLVSPLGGVERKATDGVTERVAWTPDGRSIAFNDGQGNQFGAVTLLNLETGERRRITNPPASVLGDGRFAFAPDGKSVAFTRFTSVVGGPAELYVTRLPNEPPRRLWSGPPILLGVTWAPDGKDVLTQGIDGTFWRVPVASGEPTRIAGLDLDAYEPAVSVASHRLAYSRAVRDENIWSLSGAEKAPVISSTRLDFDPELSPDGRKIAFASDRGGSWEIYVADSQGGHVVQVTSFGDSQAEGVRWSPDGRELVFGVLRRGNRDIYVVSAEGGTPRRITSEPSEEGRPSFSMDGKWIYFRSNRFGKVEIWKTGRSGGAATQVTQGGGFEAVEAVDGKTVYFLRVRGDRGLWSMPSAGGAAQALAGLEAVGAGLWGVTQDGVCYVEGGAPSTNPILCWSSSTQETSQMGIVDKPMFTASRAFSVSRDGRRFLWNQTDYQDADLVLVENFR